MLFSDHRLKGHLSLTRIFALLITKSLRLHLFASIGSLATSEAKGEVRLSLATICCSQTSSEPLPQGRCYLLRLLPYRKILNNRLAKVHSGDQMVNNHYEIEKHRWVSAYELRAKSKPKSSEYSVPGLGLIFLRYADHKFARAEKEPLLVATP